MLCQCAGMNNFISTNILELQPGQVYGIQSPWAQNHLRPLMPDINDKGTRNIMEEVYSNVLFHTVSDRMRDCAWATV